MSPALTRATRLPESAPPASAAKKTRGAGLRIGAPGDAFEREADRVADAVTGGERVPPWSFSKVRAGQVQRQAAPDASASQAGSASQQPAAPQPNNYGDAAGKLGEAFLQTDVGKKLKDAATQDPLVKSAEDFAATLPGKIIVGAAAVGTVSALAATHTPLPVQIPEIPLDAVQPGLKVKITYEGPVDHPTKAMISFSFTPQGDKKKPKQTASEQYRAETARMAADQEKFRAGMKYAPGSAEAKQQEADQKMMDDWVLHRFGALPGTGGVPLAPAKGAGQPGAGGSAWTFSPLINPELDKELDLQPATGSGTTLQRQATGPAAADVAPPLVNQVLSSAGRPLDAPTRGFMESRFGYDFGKVRIFNDDAAADSARAVAANAYTVGEKIVFNRGKYLPDSTSGRRLLAHELAHTVQQTANETRLKPVAGASSEAEAHLAGESVAGGKRLAGIGHRTEVRVAREPAADAKQAQAFTITLKYPPGREEHMEAVSAQVATKKIGWFVSQVEAHIAGGKDGLEYLTNLHHEQRIVASVSDLFGGVSLPAMEIWAPADTQVAQSRAALQQGDVKAAAEHAQAAASKAHDAETQVYKYREGTISGAGRAEFGLEVVVVASAAIVAVGTAGVAAGAGGATALTGLAAGATAGGTAATAGILAGGAYGAAQQVAGQAAEVHGGLRRKIDWGGIGFDALFGIVTGYLGGRLGGLFVKRFLANPATAALGRRVAVSVLGDLISGRSASVLHRAARMVFDRVRGRQELTVEGFIHQVIDQLLDPRGAFLDVILGAANRRLASGAPRAASSTPAGTEGPATKTSSATTVPESQASSETSAAERVEQPSGKEASSPQSAHVESESGATAATAVDAEPVHPAEAEPAPKTPAPRAKGPVIEETKIRPGVIRRRRAPAPEAPTAKATEPAVRETLSREERKARFGAGAREEIEGLGQHEREHATESHPPEGSHDVRATPHIRTAAPEPHEALGAALKENGDLPPGDGFDAHHIVPVKQAPPKLIAKLENADINLNDPRNGVWLPKTKEVANEYGRNVHLSQIHADPRAYIKALNKRLMPLKTADVPAELARIKSELMSGTFRF